MLSKSAKKRAAALQYNLNYENIKREANEKQFLFYEAVINQEGNSFYTIDFPDCPGCQSFTENKEDILSVATEALEGWLESMLEENNEIPTPCFKGHDTVRVVVNKNLSYTVRYRQNAPAREAARIALTALTIVNL